MAGLSQVVIDILKRNLFERTADVGFLATDDDIRLFLLQENDEASVRHMEARLAAYRDNYTVYDEIIIVDIHGRVRAHLDATSTITRSADSLLQQALRQDGYHETYRASDLRPGRGEVLIYAHRIMDPERNIPLGVLCLCFDLPGEMQGIYKNLLTDDTTVLCILDEQGVVLSSSHPAVAPKGSRVPLALDAECRLMSHGGVQYLVKTTRTNGYQGFYGLPWLGQAMIPAGQAFSMRNGKDALHTENALLRETGLYSGELREIDDEADEILSDLELVVLNGEVMAAKQGQSDDGQIQQEAKALPPVLGAIQQVGESIRGVFSQSISSLLQTVITARLEDAQFQAALAIDIMDRNLYERANDCRWWALTSTFRDVLAQKRIDDAARAKLNSVLAYINSLYTVYTTLFLFDADGRVAAASTPEGQRLVGKTLTGQHVRHCLQLRDPRRHCVSEFTPSAEYPGPDGQPRHTYIYNAAVFHPEQAGTVVGGVAIVFDSEPQFRAMLEDCLPRDSLGHPLPGSTAMFLDRSRRILSASDDGWRVGTMLPLDEQYMQLENGERRSECITLNGRRFIMGCAMSGGYREYKRDACYTNDVLGVVLLEI
ncbi:cache domain-containing protein [Megalodesulfovibrio paquesii]